MWRQAKKRNARLEDLANCFQLIRHRCDHQVRFSRQDLRRLRRPRVSHNRLSCRFRTHIHTILRAGDQAIERSQALKHHRRAGLQRDDATWQKVSTGSHCKTINWGASRRCRRLELKWMYSPLLLEHFEHPRNVGELPDADAKASVENPACGDVMLLTIKVG